MELFNDLNLGSFINVLTSDIAINLCEDDSSYTVYAALPGVKKENISIEFDNDVLTIDVKKDTNKDEKVYLVKEITSKNIKRSIKLIDANSNNMSAKLDNGILEINILKLKPEVTKKTIFID